MKLHRFGMLGLMLAGVCYTQAARALPFNDDMVNVQKRTGTIMRQKAPGTVAIGQSEYALKLANRDDPVERGQLAASLSDTGKVDENSLINGKRLFAVNCAPCHGDITQQPVKPGVVGQKAAQTPPDLTSASYKDRTAGAIYVTIHFGIRAMPGHGWKLSPSEKWDIVHHVQKYQAK